MMTPTILHIDASARHENSTTRTLSRQILDRMAPGQVIRRDLTTPLPQITEDWVNANFTPADQRSQAHFTVAGIVIDDRKVGRTVVDQRMQ